MLWRASYAKSTLPALSLVLLTTCLPEFSRITPDDLLQWRSKQTRQNVTWIELKYVSLSLHISEFYRQWWLLNNKINNEINKSHDLTLLQTSLNYVICFKMFHCKIPRFGKYLLCIEQDEISAYQRNICSHETQCFTVMSYTCHKMRQWAGGWGPGAEPQTHRTASMFWPKETSTRMPLRIQRSVILSSETIKSIVNEENIFVEDKAGLCYSLIICYE